MDWTRLRILVAVCTLAVMLAVPATASAAEYYPYDGSISSSYTTIFQGIVGKIDLTSDYVFFRSGQYEYMLVEGDLTYDSSFSGTACTAYRISTNTGTYNNGYVFSQETLESFDLYPGSALVYSNLGPFPDLIDRSVFYSFATLVLLFICMCLYLIRSIFSFTTRRRR